MKNFLVVAVICCAGKAYAFDPNLMIAQCNAPLSRAISVAAQSNAQSSEWNNLNLAIQQHRRQCGVPMAITCHLSESPTQCYSDLIDVIDAMSEVERNKLSAYAEAGNILFGALPEQVGRTTEVRAAEREEYCDQQSTDAGGFVGVLGGNSRAACRLEIAVNQWAVLSFSGAAPEALSLLPP